MILRIKPEMCRENVYRYTFSESQIELIKSGIMKNNVVVWGNAYEYRNQLSDRKGWFGISYTAYTSFDMMNVAGKVIDFDEDSREFILEIRWIYDVLRNKIEPMSEEYVLNNYYAVIRAFGTTKEKGEFCIEKFFGIDLIRNPDKESRKEIKQEQKLETIGKFVGNINKSPLESMKKRFPEYPPLFMGKTIKKGSFSNESYTVYGDLVRIDGKYYIHPMGNKVTVKNDLTKNPMVLHEVDPETIEVLGKEYI